MTVNVSDALVDTRMDCLSVMAVIDTREYITFIDTVFRQQGAITGQRAPLKTKSAIDIRRRMVEDIRAGAVLPPIVLGILVTPAEFSQIQLHPDQIGKLISDRGSNIDSLSLIDGMQRTTAIKEAIESDPTLNNKLRIEVWVAKSVNNLVYRMLVLNTAQIPWSLKRQLEVVYTSLRKSVENAVPGIELLVEDEKSRRAHAGQYQANHIVEMFIGFSLRKIQLELREAITEEFARLDVIESTSLTGFTDAFVEAMSFLYRFDILFEQANLPNPDIKLKRFRTGYDLFSSHPARMGFITAFSQKVFGRAGSKPQEDRSGRMLPELRTKLNTILDCWQALTPEELTELLDLPTLDERLNVPAGKVGEFEREYFLKVFGEFFEMILQDEVIEVMTPVWMAHH